MLTILIYSSFMCQLDGLYWIRFAIFAELECLAEHLEIAHGTQRNNLRNPEVECLAIKRSRLFFSLVSILKITHAKLVFKFRESLLEKNSKLHEPCLYERLRD